MTTRECFEMQRKSASPLKYTPYGHKHPNNDLNIENINKNILTI